MSSLTPIDTHVTDAQGRLLEQFNGRPNWNALLTGVAGQVQALEDAFNAILLDRLLANAQNAQLDGIGTLIGASRNNLSDSAYRLEIQAQIASDAGNATVNDLTLIAQGMFEGSSVVVSSPEPGAVAIAVGDPATPVSLYPLALQLLRQSLAAGVILSSVSSFVSASGYRLAGIDPGLGLGDIHNASAGGGLASRVA